jgi:glycosyltransferase involved in cell wall biosynthesis
MRKKVLQFIGSFNQGGSERQAVQLSRLLQSDGEFEVVIATLDKTGPLLDEIRNPAISEIREYKLNSFFSLAFLRQLNSCRKFLRANKIDIVHTHDFYTNVFGIFAARLAGVPVRIASKREITGFRTRQQERLERTAYRFANVVTVNANAVAKYLIAAGVKSNKIHLIYNGLDLERLKPKINARAKICETLGIPEEKRYVTLVANVHHRVKNQAMLLRCAQVLKKEFPEVHFVFAGEGERIVLLKDLAEKLGVDDVCHFIGRCRIVPELLATSEVCVLTSYSEGFSNSILEYMAAGKPVVATDVGGASECIEDAKSGFLVPSDDAQAMADKLRILLSDTQMAERFGAVGREIVEGRFSTEIQLQQAKQVYRNLLETV